ncbi:Ku protein [Pseudonocardia sp. RS010]|uniref:non-homologous end joining protein Ku n=1 Tax=Pseudonocardia sp. RS010 TaxID=3385979 RepID=UPI0039A2946C
MARAIWTGSITFGLVSIPVGLFTATDDHTVHFHQFQRGTSDRIRNQRVNERTGEEVDYGDIVKGAEVGDGEYVVVEPEELEQIAPGRSRTLDITDFVDLAEIDPVYFQRAYWLAPTGEEYRRPYALLREAMTQGDKAAIGTFVMRGKEYLAAVRADGDVLALHTLHFGDEVRDPSEELENVPTRRTKPGEKELRMATQLIESMSGPWKPDQYRDTYRDRVGKLIEDKKQGREIVTESEAPEPTEMSSLLEALQRSVEEARGTRSGSGGKSGGRTGRGKTGGGKTGGGKTGGGKTGGKSSGSRRKAS